jgi:hypothetical protein
MNQSVLLSGPVQLAMLFLMQFLCMNFFSLLWREDENKKS